MKFSPILLLILFFPFSDAEVEWKLVNEEEGISIFTRLNEGSAIKEVKASFEIEAELSSFLRTLNNVEKYTDWVYKCSKAERVERVNEAEFYYYTSSDFPFPISDRDMVIHSRQVFSADRKSVKTYSTAAPEKRPLVKGIVRIEHFESSWDIKEIGDGRLSVIYEAKTDPGGYLPAWIINLGIASAPLHTMQQLKVFLANN